MVFLKKGESKESTSKEERAVHMMLVLLGIILALHEFSFHIGYELKSLSRYVLFLC